ncbi:uncharacterized protein LOC126372457 [Pectinophora gossypiella]|uniref:uncharacterized protein LOC126372457 n=1 Tax=Pectinophora gossypiella TaxID=13191 RepID=UPI00214F42E5|nr:uncharacterized protein LOC126372457 [Pectinophora gossypiella]
MAGVLFIVNVPRKDYEAELNRDKTTKIVIEKERSRKTSKLVDELKENKRFSGLRSTIETYARDDDSVVISKCKSTDCLHKHDKEIGLYKCKSENTLNIKSNLNEKKKFSRSSWRDIKQVIKPKKSKLKITQPGTGVDILAAFHWDTPLETILSEVIHRLDIQNAAWNSAKNDRFWQVIFSLESGCLCEELLQVLRTFGIGSRHQSSVSVIPCALYYNSPLEEKPTSDRDNGELCQNDSNSAWSRFSSSVRARTNLAQVLYDVRAEAALTFDWLFLLVVAAFVAAIGLVENSTVILVASMLISPLMGPITAGTLGTAVRDRSLQLMGVTHELLGLFLSLIIGFIFGLAICAVDERYGVGDWPTYEMMSRCEIRSLWVGALVAIPSGAGVALAVLGDYTASLVGVAISASLLPPAVNAGLLWAMALVHLIFMDDDTRWTTVVKTTIYSDNQPTELAVLGAVSLCLTLVNIVCIFLAGVAVYKVKEVCPLERRDMSWWRANRNLLQTSRRKDRKDTSTTIPWDLYNKWRNEAEDKKDSKNTMKCPSPTMVHSDTVTYRRNRPLLRAQNLESMMAINHKNPLSSETYMPLDLETSGTYTYKSNDKPEISDSENGAKNKDVKYPFFNMAFDVPEDENKNIDHKDLPTIEPSLSYTVEPKKYGIVLSSKSFDV